MNANEAVKMAESKCKAHGVPITAKRVEVLSILLTSKCAVSAYEIADLYEEAFHDPVPVITVYRVLNFLQQKDLVHKLETANKFIVCEHISCQHTHHASQFLICKECMLVKELSVSDAEFEKISKTVKQAGFHIQTNQLEMNCICDDCFTKKSNQN